MLCFILEFWCCSKASQLEESATCHTLQDAAALLWLPAALVVLLEVLLVVVGGSGIKKKETLLKLDSRLIPAPPLSPPSLVYSDFRGLTPPPLNPPPRTARR